MGVKKLKKMRASRGRLDDATHGIINALFLLEWSINSIATACNSHWKTAQRAITSPCPSQRKKPLPPRLPTAAKQAIVLRRRRIKYLASIKESKVGPPPQYLVIEKKNTSHAQRLDRSTTAVMESVFLTPPSFEI